MYQTKSYRTLDVQDEHGQTDARAVRPHFGDRNVSHLRRMTLALLPSEFTRDIVLVVPARRYYVIMQTIP